MPDGEVRHVVTLASPDGRFGGPTRVALDLAAEQRRRGAEAVVYAGADGYRDLPDRSGDVPLRLAQVKTLVPALGFAAMVAPGLRRMVTRDLTGNEVFHVHLARDLVTLPVALELQRRSLPYVIQTHGMIDASDRRSARIVDSLMTRRAVRGASLALVLTNDEAEEVKRLSAGSTPTVLFENGVPGSRAAAGDAVRFGALFLGRLHPRKGAAVFARAAARLAPLHPSGTFRIAGPDEGDLQHVRQAVEASTASGRIDVSGPVGPDDVAAAMRSAVVFVQPAEHEPFGMTVLEAMAEGTPPILHETSALAPVVKDTDAGWTFADEDELVAVIARVLAHPGEALATGARARALAERRFSLTAVVDRLEGHYAHVR